MTEIKSVRGLKMTEEGIKPCRVIVRFTSDSRGETLSLSDDDKVMLSVAFEDVEKIIKKARKK